MASRYDLTGQRFGRLTVLKHTSTYEFPCGTKTPMWLCLCDCGATCEVQSRNLLNGRTRSCGCLRSENAKHQNERRQHA